MDWFKSSLQIAHKQAQEAAEKARALAQQATAQARVLAEQASEQAKVLAEQATENAKVFAEQATEKARQASEKAKEFASVAAEEAQARLQRLAAQTASAGGALPSDSDPADFAKYGVTPGLLETISGMTYSTFSDYPMELLPTTNPMGLAPPIPPPGFRLSSWQERHAVLVLSRGDQLQGLRFALCPKRMSEELFWVIYFTLVKTLLPPEAFAKDAPEAVEGPTTGAAGLLGSASGSAKSLRGATGGSSAMPVSTHSSTSHLTAEELPSTAAAAAARTAAAAGPGTASSGAVSSAVGGAAVLVDVNGSSKTGGDDDDDDDDVDEDDDEGAEGGEADLDALEDDPELAAYLEEALDVAEGGEAEGLSDLSSATDDLDDYINQLDAELGPDGEGEGSGEGGTASPAKPVKEAA